MLVLSRRCDEKIVIDDRVYVKVLKVSGGRVTVGVSAPPDVLIRRCEQADRFALDCGPVLVEAAETIAN